MGIYIHIYVYLMTGDEMVRWHHWLNGYGFEQAPGFGDGQGSQAWGCPRGCKKLDMTEWLNWTELIYIYIYIYMNIDCKFYLCIYLIYIYVHTYIYTYIIYTYTIIFIKLLKFLSLSSFFCLYLCLHLSA